MAVTHDTPTRKVLADAAVDQIDLGTTDATGDLQFQTAASAEVATLDFSNPAFAPAVSETATANAISPDTSAAGGTTDRYACRDRDNNERIFGSVTVIGGGGDIELTSLVIGANETVEMTSLTYTAPV